MKRVVAMVICMLLVFSHVGPALAINTDDVVDLSLVPGGATGLAGMLMPTATVNTATYTGSLFATGTFTNATVDGLGFNAGVILTTGDILGAVGPNVDSQFEVDNLEPGDAGLDDILNDQTPSTSSFNAASLSVNFTPPADTNLMIVRLVFASEEYSEDIGTIFNDIVAVYVDGVNQAFLPNTTTPITTNNAFSPTAVFNNNDPLQFEPPFGLAYDAFTNVITLRIPITANVPHDVRIVIADGGDELVDSAIFLAPLDFINAEFESLGVFRNGTWFLDMNGNGNWDGTPADATYVYGQAGDIGVVGDWNGDGASKIGIFRNGDWHVDYNGNGVMDPCVTFPSVPGPGEDLCMPLGQPGDIPVVGNWDGALDGRSKVGVFRNGDWYLDYNGNGQWDGCPVFPNPPTVQLPDLCLPLGQLGDTPVVGDWNGDGRSKIGIFRNGDWYVDYNGNGQWDGDGVPLNDAFFPLGLSGDVPVVGKWDGLIPSKIGLFRAGDWFIDYNGNGSWNGCGASMIPNPDVCAPLGQPADQPVVGNWFIPIN